MTYRPKRRKTIFNMAAAAMLNRQKLLFWSSKPCLHVTLPPRYKFVVNQPNWPRDIGNYIFLIWRPMQNLVIT